MTKVIRYEVTEIQEAFMAKLKRAGYTIRFNSINPKVIYILNSPIARFFWPLFGQEATVYFYDSMKNKFDLSMKRNSFHFGKIKAICDEFEKEQNLQIEITLEG